MLRLTPPLAGLISNNLCGRAFTTAALPRLVDHTTVPRSFFVLVFLQSNEKPFGYERLLASQASARAEHLDNSDGTGKRMDARSPGMRLRPTLTRGSAPIAAPSTRVFITVVFLLNAGRKRLVLRSNTSERRFRAVRPGPNGAHSLFRSNGGGLARIQGSVTYGYCNLTGNRRAAVSP